MHHFIAVDDDVNRFEGVTQLLDLQGIASDRRIPLLYIVQLLLELKLVCSLIGRKNLVRVASCFFRIPTLGPRAPTNRLKFRRSVQ